MRRLLMLLMCVVCLCMLTGCGGEQASSNAVARSGATSPDQDGGAPGGGSEAGDGDGLAMDDFDSDPGEMDDEDMDDEDMDDEDMDDEDMDDEDMDDEDMDDEDMDDEDMDDLGEGDEEDFEMDDEFDEEADDLDMEDEGEIAMEEDEEGEFGGEGSVRSRPRPEKPDTSDFAAMAKYLFQVGSDQNALKYHYADALSSNEVRDQLLSTVQWVPGLKRPALVVRFGVGVELTAPPNLSDYKPIGSTQQIAGGRSRDRRVGGEDSEDDFGGVEDFGGGEDEGEDGFVDGEDGEEGFGDGSGGRSGGRIPGAHIRKYAGALSDKIMEGIQSRIKEGQFGAVLKAAVAAGGSGGDVGHARSDARGSRGGAGDDASSEISSMMTGVTFLGVGEGRALAARAREQGVDVLVLFRVTVRPNRKTGHIVNDTELILSDARTRARLHTIKKLNNLKVQLDRQNKKDDPVEKELERVFAYVDENLLMTPLPDGLNPKNVLENRIKPLLKESLDDRLPALCEIDFWHSRELLTVDHKLIAFGQLLGPEAAQQLASDSEDERRAVVAKMLPE